MAGRRPCTSLLLLAAAAAALMPAAVSAQPPAAGCPWSFLTPVPLLDAADLAAGGTDISPALKAGNSYILGTGVYLMKTTTTLNPGDRICVTGQGKNATTVLFYDLAVAPGDTGNHFLLSGGDAGVYLQDLTLEGTPLGGGIWSRNTNNTPTIPNLVTAVRVDITSCPTVALLTDNALTAAFHDSSFLENEMSFFAPQLLGLYQGGAMFLYNDQPDVAISVSLTGTTVFKDNSAIYHGGAIYCFNGGNGTSSITISSTGDVTFDGNRAVGDPAASHLSRGGAIMLGGGKISVNFGGASSNVQFIENRARGIDEQAYGGAIHIEPRCSCTSNDMSITFACKAVEFTRNRASTNDNAKISSGGGAISMSNDYGLGGKARVTFQAPVSFTGNRAGTYASAIEMYQQVPDDTLYDPGTLVFGASACFTNNYVNTQPTQPEYDFVLWVTGGSVQVAAAAALSFSNNRGPNQTWPEADVFIQSPGQVFCGASGTNKSEGAYAVQGDLCSAATCGAAQATNCTCAAGAAVSDAGACGTCKPPCNSKPTLVVPGANPWPDSCAAGNFAGAKCSTTCIQGFEGAPAAVCTLSGQWGPAGGCTPTPCFGLPPITPPGSSWTGTLCALPGYRTESNGSCTAQCLPGFTGAPAVVCSGGSWVTAPLAGTPCSPNSCPATPSQTPPHASWPAAGCNTTSGAVCQATCAAGFAGQPSSTCSAGAWSAIQGPACVSCGASLAAPVPPPAAVCAGAALTATFTLTSASVTNTTFTATVDGVACVPPPGSLQQAYPGGVQVPVTCSAPAASGGFAAGQRTISLAAAYVGSAPCPSGSTPAVTTTVVVNPPPTVSLSGVAVTQPTCTGSSMVVSFSYAVAGATPGAGPVLLSTVVSSSYGQQHAAACKATTKGDSSQGSISIECPGGSFQAVGQTAQISLQLSAVQGSCTAGQGLATVSVPIVCCVGAGGSGSAVTSYAAGLPGAQCLAPAPFFKGPTAPGASAQLVTSISSRCNTTAASKVVGAVATECVPGAKIMTFAMTLGAGSTVSKLRYRLSCSSPATWMDVPTPLSLPSTQQRFNLNVTTTPAGDMLVTWVVSREGVAFQFCACESWLWSLSVAGSFTDVDPSYCAPSASAASLKRAARRRTGNP